MAPKQIKFSAKDLVSRNPSPEVRALYDRVLKHAYEDQQKILQAARDLDNSKNS